MFNNKIVLKAQNAPKVETLQNKLCLNNHWNLIKLQFVQAIFAFLLIICHAESRPDYEPPYGEKLHPKPFQYEYGLEPASSGAAFSKKETQVTT